MSDQTFCINHPNVPTSLRCNKCGSPICPRCAVRTPVGYRCKSCVKNQQAIFYTAMWYDYVIAAVVSMIISGVAHVILLFIPFLGFLVIFAGFLIGGAVAEVVRILTGKRRGRYTWLAVATGIVIGALPSLLMALATQSMFNLEVIFIGASVFLAVGAASARLRLGK